LLESIRSFHNPFQPHPFNTPRNRANRRNDRSSLVVATGSNRNRLGVSGGKQLLAKGGSYCVACDANFFRKQPVAVVGNESAAAGCLCYSPPGSLYPA
jgi:thioredoxin reductase